MIVSEPNPASTASAHDGGPGLYLRIRSATLPGRIVTLANGRSTIGSSPRCNVCIQEPGIQPLHCLIVAEDERASVRPWAPETLLNGQPFDEAELAAGDVLSVGPVDMEVVGERIEDQPQPVRQADILAEPPVEDRFEEGSSATNSIPSTESSLEEDEPEAAPDDATWLESSDELIADLTNSAFTAEDLGPAIEYHVPTLEEWEWAASENARLSDEIMQLAGAHERLVQELVAVAQDTTILFNRLDETERRQATEAADEAIWQAQLQEWKDLLGDFGERMERLEGKFAANHDDAPDAPLRQAESGMDSPSSEALPNETAGDAEHAIAHRGDLAVWKAQSEHAPAASPVEFEQGDDKTNEDQTNEGQTNFDAESQPVDAATSNSFIERYSHQFAGEESESEGPSSVVAERAEIEPQQELSGRKAARPSAGQPAAALSDDEESIEAYMAKLLQRVRGETVHAAYGTESYSAHSPAKYDGQSPDIGTSTATGPLLLPDRFESDDKPTHPMAHLWEMTRRSPAPEKAANLEALRALANQTARRAIGAHASRTHRRQAMTKFIVAMLAGTTSLWLMLEAPDWRDLQFISACVSLVAAAYWAGQTYGSFVESIRAGTYGGPSLEETHGDPSQLALPVDID